MRRPDKILHVLNSAGGGAALSTLALIRALRAEGVRSAAVCHDAGTQQERAELRDAVEGEVIFTRLYWWNRKNRMPLWRRPLAEAKQIWLTGWSRGSAERVRRFAQQTHAELIHTNTLLTPEGGMAAQRLGLPHVWHLRELVGPGNPFRFTHEGRSFGKRLAPYCSKIVANSLASAAAIRDWLPPGMLETVFNGIDICRFHPRAALPAGKPIVVGMVGNLTSRSKKHSLLIDAAALVDHGLPIEWRIYGHDPSAGGSQHGDTYVDALHAQINSLGLTDRFRWPGFLSDPVEIMAQIDILVHPADNESFGRVVVEAMAAGLPTIGVRGGGVAEIIRHEETGLLTRPDDARDLAAAVELLARDPDRRFALGQAGRRRAESLYSLGASTAGMLRVYQQAMELPLGKASGQSKKLAIPSPLTIETP
jgi:glycosyltransferase involved in cell wall biosynthesis